MMSAAARIQIATITPAAIFPVRVTLPTISSDLARHSATTSAGTRRMTSMIPSGMRIRSSRYPRTGMKSGIRSIGERA